MGASCSSCGREIQSSTPLEMEGRVTCGPCWASARGGRPGGPPAAAAAGSGQAVTGVAMTLLGWRS